MMHSGEPAKTVARTIMKRHIEQRQRFDSADYVMIQTAAAASNTQSQQQQQRRPLPDEHEPEPEATQRQHSAPPSPLLIADNTSMSGRYPQQQVRRIRLQRFDSADWVLDAQKQASGAATANVDDGGNGSSCPQTAAVAKLLLDRHAYATCLFVTTPVQSDARCAEKA